MPNLFRTIEIGAVRLKPTFGLRRKPPLFCAKAQSGPQTEQRRFQSCAMSSAILLVFLCLCFALPSHAAPTSQSDPPSHLAPTVSQVAHQIICDCPDCGKQTVDQCMATCTRGKELAQEIKGQIGQGKSQDQIVEFLGKTHGEQILAIPRQSNFLGRMAPLAPFLLLLAGVVPIVYITRTRQRKARIRGPKQTPQKLKSDDDRLDDALKSFDY